MKNRIIKFVTIFLSAVILLGVLSGCGGNDEPDDAPVDEYVIPFSIYPADTYSHELHIRSTDNVPSFPCETYADGHVFLVELVELISSAYGKHKMTLQVFTVHSQLEAPEDIITLTKINHDSCPDLLVRLNQGDSSAFYNAYRFLPEGEIFETDPFFTFCGSGIPELFGEDMLLTTNTTDSTTEKKLYVLDENGDYSPLRTLLRENSDRCEYTVFDDTAEERTELYHDSFPSDNIPAEENLKINSLFFCGDGQDWQYPYINSIIDSARSYCYMREWDISQFYRIEDMLIPDSPTYISEKEYIENRDRTVICEETFANSFDFNDDGTFRVNVVCLMRSRGGEVSDDEEYICYSKYLSVSISADIGTYFDNTVISVEEGISPDEDENAWLNAEYDKHDWPYIFFYDSEHDRIENDLWQGYRTPEIHFVDANILMIYGATKTGKWGRQFFNIDTCEQSNVYYNDYYLGNGVTMYLSDHNKINIVSVFDESEYKHTFESDRINTYEDAYVDPDEYFDNIYSYRLIDSTHLWLMYYDENFEKKEITLEIPEIPGME